MLFLFGLLLFFLFVFNQAAVSAYLLQLELDNVWDIRMKMDWTKYFINAIGDLVMLRQKPLETGIFSDHVIWLVTFCLENENCGVEKGWK